VVLQPYKLTSFLLIAAQGRLEDDHLANDLVHINQLTFRSILLEEQANPADDFRRTSSVFDDSHRSRARLFQIGVIARKPAQAGIGGAPRYWQGYGLPSSWKPCLDQHWGLA